MTPTQLDAGHAPLASAGLLVAAPSAAGAKQGCCSWEATGTGKRLCWSRARYHRLGREEGVCLPGITNSCERTGGLSTASSAPLWSLYQMVKSTGTGFSFPPKLDKLESNELVRGKIKSSALLSKKNPPKSPLLTFCLKTLPISYAVVPRQFWRHRAGEGSKGGTHPWGSRDAQERALPHPRFC